MSAVVQFRPPANAVDTYPDTARYNGGVAIRSESSSSGYKISFDAAPGAMYWTCSCPGNIRHGDCKHLRAIGLKGRRYGAQREEAKKFGFAP